MTSEVPKVVVPEWITVAGYDATLKDSRRRWSRLMRTGDVEEFIGPLILAPTREVQLERLPKAWPVRSQRIQVSAFWEGRNDANPRLLEREEEVCELLLGRQAGFILAFVVRGPRRPVCVRIVRWLLAHCWRELFAFEYHRLLDTKSPIGAMASVLGRTQSGFVWPGLVELVDLADSAPDVAPELTHWAVSERLEGRVIPTEVLRAEVDRIRRGGWTPPPP
ncbi:MAG: hypothetical protein KF901_25635 [Myxococcales bacterium]|nr:hypothetical protein [Myxococcales bacterium]